MKPILEHGVKQLLQLPTAEETGQSCLWATLPTLCDSWGSYPKCWWSGSTFLAKEGNPEWNFEEYWTILMPWFWKSVVLETTAFHLKCSQWPKWVHIPEIQTLNLTPAWLSGGAWWSQRYFHKIHAHHTAVDLCGCILALTPEGTELCLLQGWNK